MDITNFPYCDPFRITVPVELKSNLAHPTRFVASVCFLSLYNTSILVPGTVA